MAMKNTEIPKDCFQVENNKNLRVFSNDLFYLSAKNIEQASHKAIQAQMCD